MKMIHRAALLAILCIVAAAAGRAQSQDTNSDTLKAILAELRAIHQDMQVTATTQLLVAELQMQQSVVTRATESADSARGQLEGVHRSQQQITAEIERTQDRLDKETNSDQKNQLGQRIEQMKSTIDMLKNSERDSDTKLQDMQQRLRDAQDKLAGIEAELNAAISRLAPVSK